jgi:hypothetical protein
MRREREWKKRKKERKYKKMHNNGKKERKVKVIIRERGNKDKEKREEMGGIKENDGTKYKEKINK